MKQDAPALLVRKLSEEEECRIVGGKNINIGLEVLLLDIRWACGPIPLWACSKLKDVVVPPSVRAKETFRLSDVVVPPSLQGIQP
ncbi:hypothetical protein LC605_06055 [Nostoc sp. CHAB 5836]|uniref:hypothetical protein n=1 Tax=Nostoc sp. CHAB 5836 TaxID=2780404 RepID=UPI001E4C8B6B|nr:hypothetical protein [Nostoc sp. CHAB 5836]MCC5614645.1 hypothetical protein [Nostoc sp. CHAB 5836]